MTSQPAATPEPAPTVGAVGSPSSNAEITLELTGDSAQEPLVGQMVYLEHRLGERRELALGTVTEVTTVNQWHQNPSMRGVVKLHGRLPNLSEVGDVRGAAVRIQAVYQRADDASPWRQAGASLSMSPSTADQIHRVSDQVLARILAAYQQDVFYLGRAYRMNVRLPLNIGDFRGIDGSEGAFHTAAFGLTGSGKSAFSTYLLAAQMRFPDLGMLIIDPQGQWTSERDLPFSLQDWAKQLGRRVLVRRIATDLRLQKDAPLFTELLAKTKFFREFAIKHPDNQESARYELEKHLRSDLRDWPERPSDQLLRELLTHLATDPVIKRIYSIKERRTEVQEQLDEVLGNARRFRQVSQWFTPLHSLFQPTNLRGQPRTPLWNVISAAFTGRPRPLVILDMSSEGLDLGDHDLHDHDEDIDLQGLLESTTIKARILRQACGLLKRAAASAYKDKKELLNTLVVLDEARDYAAPPRTDGDPEVTALSRALEQYARQTRKLGLGWFFITQPQATSTPASGASSPCASSAMGSAAATCVGSRSMSTTQKRSGCIAASRTRAAPTRASTPSCSWAP
jgi:DNA helicase HerA-like ATPase